MTNREQEADGEKGRTGGIYECDICVIQIICMITEKYNLGTTHGPYLQTALMEKNETYRASLDTEF